MHESEKWKWSHSVLPDSSGRHGLQPTRLLLPWDFPSKSPGVAIAFSDPHHRPTEMLTLHKMNYSPWCFWRALVRALWRATVCGVRRDRSDLAAAANYQGDQKHLFAWELNLKLQTHLRNSEAQSPVCQKWQRGFQVVHSLCLAGRAGWVGNKEAFGPWQMAKSAPVREGRGSGTCAYFMLALFLGH